SPIPLSACRKIGIGLQRPEDVVVGRDGRVWASDQQSACAQILPDGSLKRVGKAGGAPNGINMDSQGRIIIANFEAGPVQRLDVESGTVEAICSEVAGGKLPDPRSQRNDLVRQLDLHAALAASARRSR